MCNGHGETEIFSWRAESYHDKFISIYYANFLTPQTKRSAYIRLMGEKSAKTPRHVDLSLAKSSWSLSCSPTLKTQSAKLISSLHPLDLFSSKSLALYAASASEQI